MARVPQAPRSLLGLANLRGAVLPVVSLRALLGQPPGELGASSRLLVLAGASPAALAVDTVEALVSVDRDAVETGQGAIAAQPGERLIGAFRRAGGEDVVKILDIQPLLDSAFVARTRPARRHRTEAHAGPADRSGADRSGDNGRIRLISFDVAGQEYALGLAEVREIIPAPTSLAMDPRSEALLLGVAAYRDTLLPLFSLRGLLGFPPGPADQRSKVVVTTVAGALVGLVVDRMRAIIGADPTLVEPTPSVLAARTGGEARIKAIYRDEGGRRLISILATGELFRETVMQRLDSAGGGDAPAGAREPAARDEERVFLVFRLGDDEFGLPIEAVDEVVRIPARITRVPKTPAFLEGVINLRGEVLPVVDQRRRFGMPEAGNGPGRRIVVVRTERHRAGLIVDSVVQVLRRAGETIGEAPDLTGETTRLVNGVINLDESGRIILLLDPAELLSRAERGLLDAFQADPASQTDPAPQTDQAPT